MLCPTQFMADGPAVRRNNQLANEWLTWLRDTRGRTPQTTYNYASVLAMYLDECVGVRPLDGVTESQIEEWLLRPRGGRAKGRVASPATRARNVTVLRSFYTWLHARDLVRDNVAARLVAPKIHNRNPRPIPDGLWREGWSAAPPRMLTTLGLGFFLGLRRAEIVNLRAEHVDVQRGMLVGFVRKGGGDDTMPAVELLEVFEDRAAPLAEPHGVMALWHNLERLAADPLGPDGRLLGHTSPDHVNQHLRRYLERLGIPRAFTPHALRHSFVTNLLRCGMPIELVSELANHSSLNVTMRYAKLGGGRLAEWRLGTQRVTVADWR
jgi:integrase